MGQSTRRDFIRSTATGLAGAATLAGTSNVLGANERFNVAVIGCGGQGRTHINSLRSLDNVRITAVCDPDQKRLADAVKRAEGARGVKDLRQIIDDKSIDAVTIATPDHWHGPAAIMAMDAGKHVYVEKPCSHNLREGRLMVDAARRNKAVCQHGTQSRSAPMIRSAVEALHNGVIGDVLVARVWNVQFRGNIGRAQPGNPPAGFDYPLWLGPAPHIAWQRNRHHYTWHWWHHFGTGDMGNDGVHDIDYARWGLGVNDHPDVVAATGGKYFHDDDQQFPDTQVVTFEWDGVAGTPLGKKQLIYEMRLWSTSYPYDVDSGVEFHGTKGRMLLSKRGKVEVVGHRNRPRNDVKVEGGGLSIPNHMRNFFDCINNGATPNADIEIGFKSSALVHLGNLSTRVGRTLHFDVATETVVGDDDANKLLRREYEPNHWAIPAGVAQTYRKPKPKPGQVTMAKRGQAVVAHVSGKPVGRFMPGDERCTRPYIAEVRAPNGVQATRNYPPKSGDAQDHGHMHPGIHMAFGDIGGTDVWRLKARVEHVRYAHEPTGSGAFGGFTVEQRYVDGKRVVCHETCNISLRVTPFGHLWLYDSTFKNDAADFYFGDQEEMGLAIRVATPIAVTGGGRILDSEGRKNGKEVWGQSADWCDYSGKVGGTRVGLLLMPDPANFRPSWYHARDYGLLVANPFGRAAMKQGKPSRVDVKRGESLRLRFGVLAYSGEIDLNEAYEVFKSGSSDS